MNELDLVNAARKLATVPLDAVITIADPNAHQFFPETPAVGLDPIVLREFAKAYLRSPLGSAGFETLKINGLTGR